MRAQGLCRAVFFAGIVFGSPALIAAAQTDVAASLYGAFTPTSTGNATSNTIQSPSNSAGVLLELRHVANPFVGYEATYSYNRANQTYTFSPPYFSCGGAHCAPASVPANAHEITGDWIVSLPLASLKPFLLAGGGLLLDVPSNGNSTTNSSAEGVFVYGGGVDWGLLPHLGLRVQYRGNLYKAPHLTNIDAATNVFTHTAEPMIGAYFRF